VGATPLRNEKAAEILDSVRMAVIKGNASEIAKLAGEAAETRGVEATDVAGDRAAICGGLSRSRQAAVVMTGERDIVTDGRTVTVVKNGHPMMGRIVGTGCMAASVIGAFCAVGKDSAMSAVAALVCFEVAAELAAADAPGPGTFKVRLFDELFNLDRTHIERMAKIETGTA
jgi:hydroxyethylthiazole kinase